MILITNNFNMILDYENILKIIEGSPLEGLSMNQLQDSLIGQYPIIYGSSQFDRNWKNINQDKLIQIQLKESAITIIFDTILLNLFKQKQRDEAKINNIQIAKQYIKEMSIALHDNIAMKSIISDYEKVFVKYEIESRKDKLEIKSLKSNIYE